MPGVLDFLFEGNPPKSVSTYGETIENIPKWMSDYTQGMIAKANAAAAEPYIPFEGPRIAGFTPEQEAGFKLGEENVGAYKPFLDEARTGAGAAAAGVPTGLGFLQQAGESTFPGAVDQYMDPYIQNVLNRQESMAGRTLEEKFLPALSRKFIGAGQYGSRGVGPESTSMEASGVRGVRDIMENLEEQRLATLSGAYGQAADIYGQDIGRQADVGAQMGQLGLQGAQQVGGLGQMAQQMGLTDAATMEAIGAQKQQMGQTSLDLAQRDFQEQKDLPFDRLQFMQSMLQGTPYSTQTQRTDVGPADIYQPSGLAQIAGAYGTYKGMTEARGGRIRRPRYAKGGLARAVIDLDPSEWEVVENA
jgi:hypothetical protein